MDENIDIVDHVEKDVTDECGYCGQVFGPDFVVIEKVLHGRMWHFCSEECLHDFKDASNFKDQNLDAEPELEMSYEEKE